MDHTVTVHVHIPKTPSPPLLHCSHRTPFVLRWKPKSPSPPLHPLRESQRVIDKRVLQVKRTKSTSTFMLWHHGNVSYDLSMS